MRPEPAPLLVLALITAGCVGGATAGTPAMEPRESASEEATAWDEDARLVGVFAADLSQQEIQEERREANRSDEEEADRFRLHRAARSADGEVGDGKAGRWLYEYRAGGRAYRILVAANGTVLDTARGPAEEDEAPIQGWEVDSDEAAEILAENNDAFADAEGARSAFYALFANTTDANPVWAFGLFLADRAPVVYTVDARTGEYRGSQPVAVPGFSIPNVGYGGPNGSRDAPSEEGGNISGTLTATEPRDEESFALADDEHPQLEARLALEGQSAGSTVQVTVQVPDGRSKELTVSSSEGSGRLAFDAPADGMYNVTLELTKGVRQGYTFTWCAEGERIEGSDAAAACRAIEDGSAAWAGPVAER